MARAAGRLQWWCSVLLGVAASACLAAGCDDGAGSVEDDTGSGDTSADAGDTSEADGSGDTADTADTADTDDTDDATDADDATDTSDATDTADADIGPTCDDNVRNGDETDVDCGGATCGVCGAGQGCAVDSDCSRGFCHPVDLICSASECGDGFVSDGEVCDDAGESATCDPDCTPPECGDGVANASAGEGCDDGNADDTDGCTNACAVAVCGDGIVGPGEACDDGNSVDDDACTNACALASCGDGIVQSGEDCDDANQDDTDGCLTTCVSASCGDGFVQTGVETCDSMGESAGCDADCTAASCGDGVTNTAAGEGCDDADTDDTDACTTLCQAPSCSDGIVSGAETGTDCGGADCGLCAAGEGCASASDCQSGVCDVATGLCAAASCGDGVIQGSEACDDGGESAGCDANCTMASCGDGTVNATAGEGCDDGDTDETDTCTTLCQAPSCSDGIVSGTETDLECGGASCPGCALGEGCVADADCAAGRCDAGSCHYPIDCLDAQLNAGMTTDGITTIDPDGAAGAIAPFDVWCDQTTDGGGWTLVGRSAPTPAAINCVAGDGGSNFGWMSSRGSITDDTQAYSLDVAANGLDTFEEMLFGNYASAKTWDGDVFKHTGIGAGFVATYATTHYRHGDAQLVTGSCLTPPTMFSWIGFTSNTDSFHFRDVDGNGYGLTSSGWRSCYNGCLRGGNLNGDAGMLMVRRDRCADGVQNGDESDVDCGGALCGGCAPSAGCASDGDCASGVCTAGTCGAYDVSCLGILTAATGTPPSGVYTIDPDGAAGITAPFAVSCDMTTDGGGWTLIGHLYAGERSLASIDRGQRFFTAAWEQHTGSFTAGTNESVQLGGTTYGMLDATALIDAAGELRFSCLDQTRSLSADAIWAADAATRTDYRDSVLYSSTAASMRVSQNGAAYATVDAYPTAAPATYWGSWHICGSGSAGPGGFQVGVCHNTPTTADSNLTAINQVAFGYHAGFTGLRLECTADTPSDTALIDGSWSAWVR